MAEDPPSITIYLEGYQSKGETWVSIKSLVSLFVLQCCEDLDINIVFTYDPSSQRPLKEGEKEPVFSIDSRELFYEFCFMLWEDVPETIKNCLLPAAITDKESWIVAGLCSSLRYVLDMKAKHTGNPNHIAKKLLGFREGCLNACTGSSVWTKFCEVDAIHMLYHVYFKSLYLHSFLTPIEMIRFQFHMTYPPILHNALKKKQEKLKESSTSEMYSKFKNLKLHDLPELKHVFAEGIDFTLADFLLFVPFYLSTKRIVNILNLERDYPNVMNWLSVIESMDSVSKGKGILKRIVDKHPAVNIYEGFRVLRPFSRHMSLYKSDPDRHKSGRRSFTHQDGIDEASKEVERGINIQENTLSINELNLDGRGVDINLTSSMEVMKIDQSIKRKTEFVSSFSVQQGLNWKELPSQVHPAEGELPVQRLERKCQQLESMVQIVMQIAKENDKIVDFCSGGGHLGILTAFLLPKCEVFLVENKSESLIRAYRRVKLLNLKNVYFYQCNLDNFAGKFDVGLGLHACGVSTDMVMKKCISQRASFVCSPCCYGSIYYDPALPFPRSMFYKEELEISPDQHLILGHAADQTHDENNPKTLQGKRCMQYVDIDRLYFAREHGYKTTLTVMNPPQCSPKNHILVGTL